MRWTHSRQNLSASLRSAPPLTKGRLSTSSVAASPRHLPLMGEGFFAPAPLAPLRKGSWRAAPERSLPPQRKGFPYEGKLSPKVTDEVAAAGITSPPRFARHLPLDKGRLSTSSVAAPPRHLPLIGEGFFSCRAGICSILRKNYPEYKTFDNMIQIYAIIERNTCVAAKDLVS